MMDSRAVIKLEKYAEKMGYSLDIPDFHQITDSGKIELRKPKDYYYGGFNIEVFPHPDCCGTKIFSSIHDEENKTMCWILIKAAILSCWGNGSLQYTCTNEQPEIENALRGNGFKLVQKVVNPKTRAILKLYVYNQK